MAGTDAYFNTIKENDLFYSLGSRLGEGDLRLEKGMTIRKASTYFLKRTLHLFVPFVFKCCFMKQNCNIQGGVM